MARVAGEGRDGMNRPINLSTFPPPLTLGEHELAVVATWSAAERAEYESAAAHAEFIENKSLADAEAAAFEQAVRARQRGGRR